MSRATATATATARKQHKIRAQKTHDLIESDKVVGTNIYRPGGERIGKVERLMIDKHSGQVAYAVMSFGGFLGLGHEHYPVPWARLDYSPKLEGFEVGISDEELKHAPKFDPGEDWDWSDPDMGRRIYSHYRIPPYWA